MDKYDATQSSIRLGTFKTNRDQAIGSAIAEAAALIAKEARLHFDRTRDNDNDIHLWTIRAQNDAERP